MIFNMSSGGQPLNFKVVGGTAAPDAPRENMVWVNTDAEITSWIFCAAQPETPAEGMVWIATGRGSNVEFNALKKNGIQVCPLSAMQYVSGAWVDVTAKSYQGGAWVDWINWNLLFDYGDNTAVTGGWTIGSGHTRTVNSDGSWTITHNSNQSYVSSLISNDIDLTDKNTLYFQGSLSGTSATFGIWSPSSTINGNTAAASVQGSCSGTQSIDISALSGLYRIGFCGFLYGQTCVIEKLWLE